MNMIRLLIWLTVISMLTAPMHAFTQVCTGIVQQALDITHELCDQIGTNEACYGHARLDAQPQAGLMLLDFEDPGDRIDVTALRSLRLSALDEETGLWGVARMAVQPSAPDVDPGEQVTFLLFGDVEIQNLIPPPSNASARVLSRLNLNFRREPRLDAYVSRTLPTGTVVTAHGRTADNRWLYVETNDGELGWVSAPAMQVEDGLATVSAVEPYAASFGPMQAFRLETGADGLLCDDMPESGVLIQTPDGVAEVSLWINEVKVRLGSTAYIRAGRSRTMRITMLEGQARVEAQGRTVTAPAGTELTIQLDQNLAPVSPPSAAQQIQQPVNNLPVEDLDRLIPTLTPTNTLIPPSNTPVPTATPTLTFTPTATLEPPSATPLPPTATPLPPATATAEMQINLTPTEEVLTDITPTDAPTDVPTDIPPTDAPTDLPPGQARQLTETPPGRGTPGRGSP